MATLTWFIGMEEVPVTFGFGGSGVECVNVCHRGHSAVLAVVSSAQSVMFLCVF